MLQLPPKPELSKIVFGDPVQLFNGKNLDGWYLSNPEQLNGWRAEGGCLVNESPKKTFEPFSRYGNLCKEKTFGDGKLTIEFNVPSGGNSGIYVRGSYEAQVVDRDSRMQGIQGIGAIFGRIAPSENAGKVGGQWQSYEITIIDRHATVILNGKTVIDNQPLLGNTNGAFQADVMNPGPLYLQGDHTAVKYRNIFFYPLAIVCHEVHLAPLPIDFHPCCDSPDNQSLVQNNDFIMEDVPTSFHALNDFTCSALLLSSYSLVNDS